MTREAQMTAKRNDARSAKWQRSEWPRV